MNTPSTAVRTAAQIRQDFLDFFVERHGHVFVPSSPVVPHDDPTLLFTNAGMNQFKDIFLGHAEGVSGGGRRAANSQKCIRAGGKHNDLEDVGRDTYHHTFFEMLGNWSFGDYFKEEAITWAWELLTGVWGLDPDRLFVTVFAGDANDGLGVDDEAEAIWKRVVPADRISRWGRKDNFWEMGETGPCGPCSEIHYDSTPDRTGAALVNKDHPDVIEIWNLVFIQYNRGSSGVLTPLPAKHVDTGMGFERIARVLQGQRSNYDTDVWRPIFAAIEKHTGAHPYQGRADDPIDVAYRIIADHSRCLTVAINDGAFPGNEGRGYVLRRILRRAVRHAHQTLGVEGPLLCDLVPAVVETLGGAFPELNKKPDRITGLIRDEEESFLRTLDRGLQLFGDAVGRAKAAGSAGAVIISADDAFKLHDTYGFPIDLTRVMAEEQDLVVDEAGYETRMNEARELSRQGGGTSETLTLPPEAIARLRHLGVDGTNDIDKFHGRPITATVRAIWNGSNFDETAHLGQEVVVILSRTNHYGESGGQVGDRGKLMADVSDLGAASARGYGGRPPEGHCRFKIDDTQRVGEYVLHIGHVIEDKLEVGDTVDVVIDRLRRDATMANHTGTHLLNHALRAVIGDEVEQRGSHVGPDRLRFDFTATHAMGAEAIAKAETLVNESIARGETVYAELVPLDVGRRIQGLRAVFGERYPDPVRVVSVGQSIETLTADPENDSWNAGAIEFCGGTHVPSTKAIGSFVIVHEQALAAGIRRITAQTGPAADASALAAAGLEARVRDAQTLEDDALVAEFDGIASEIEHLTLAVTARHRLKAALEGLRDRVKAIRKAERQSAQAGVNDQAKAIAEAADGSVIVEVVDGADKNTLLNAINVITAIHPEAAVMLFAPDAEEGRVSIAAVVPKAIITQGLKAGDWVRAAAQVCGGGGGGRPDRAQAGGKDVTKVDAARAAAIEFAGEKCS